MSQKIEQYKDYPTIIDLDESTLDENTSIKKQLSIEETITLHLNDFEAQCRNHTGTDKTRFWRKSKKCTEVSAGHDSVFCLIFTRKL